jgi:hypothetical protein
MQKPRPRSEFASHDDEMEHLLDCICWLQAEQMSLDLGMSTEDCADQVKLELAIGRIVIEFDEKRDRYRLMPAPSLAGH